MRGVIEKVEGLLDGMYRISILSHQKPQIGDLIHKPITYTLREEKARRSLDANAYYWVLIGKLADALRMSKSELHNIMLRRYGQFYTIDGRAVYIVIPETEDAQKKVDNDEHFHLRPTSQVKVGKDGKQYRTYMLLKGSHEFDTREMSILIDGIVSECKEAGIETVTPDEIQRMKELYQERYARKNKEVTV